MTLPLPRPGPTNYQDEAGFELDLLWDQAADAIESTDAAVTAHLANTSNPHSVTKAQVGLGSVDNTADTNKPVSTAQAAADTAIGSAAASDATTKANSAQAAAIAACPAETATTIGALTAGATTKATPVDADVIGLSDSAASNVLKKLSWANLKTALQSVFATLAGTSGGQTLRGGTAASETLTLQSTASATKGKILFGTSAYDEVNNRLGVGQTTPTAALHLKAGTASSSTAPLKFTSGTALTTPEAGAVEYTGGKFLVTRSDAVRQNVATETFIQSMAGNLIENGSGLQLNNSNFSNYVFDATDVAFGPGSFRANVATSTYLTDSYVNVDPDMRYTLSLWAKSGDVGGGNYSAANRQYFGVAQYDADQLLINPGHSCKVSSGAVDTTLAVALNPGDTTITLADATGWNNNATVTNNNFAWYGYTNGKGYTYPDYSYTRLGSSLYSSNSTLGCWVAGGISGNVITLRVPWAGPALAAGASVRNCAAFVGSYNYIALGNALVPNAWTKYTGNIGSVSIINLPNSFRAGCAYLRFLHLVNYHGAADNNIRISGVSISLISSANLESQVGVGATYKYALPSGLPVNGLAVEGKLGVGTVAPGSLVHVLGTTEQLRIGYDAANYGWLTCSSTGGLSWSTTGAAGIGVNAQLYCTVTNATTNAVDTVLTINKSVTGAGVGAAGLGGGILFRAETSTTADTTQAYIYGTWTDATHATYKSRLTLGAYDSASTREGLRLEADGSVARIGFYGATAVVKPTALTATVAAAPAGGTGTAAGAWDTSGNRDLAIATINNLKTRVDQLETKLQALGLLT